MDKYLLNNIKLLEQPSNIQLLSKVNRGIERECLRIDRLGLLSQKKHPKNLGSSLTNPYITTDFSEALLELITPTFNHPKKLWDFLFDLHSFTCLHIDEEYLWPLSMPCLKEDEKIPIATFGNSNVGRMKHLYRLGLHHRYGSLMQTIAGIHYNFSMPDEFWPFFHHHLKSKKSIKDFKSESYFNMIRNIQKHNFLIYFLFGASPAVCSNFVQNNTLKTGLLKKEKGMYFAPFGTTLRMSQLGYQNHAKSDISICYRNLANYTEDLDRMIRTPDSNWSKIDLIKDGEYQQINNSILQIENEYYSNVRPKQRIMMGERPTVALNNRGVEYVELRSLDINPWSEVGISFEQIKFLDMFLTWSLLKQSDCCIHEDTTRGKYNSNLVIWQGRKEGLILKDGDKDRSLEDWGLTIVEELRPIADMYEKALKTSYNDVLDKIKISIKNPDQTFSGIMLNELEKENFCMRKYSMGRAFEFKDKFLAHKIMPEREKLFFEASEASINKHNSLESSKQIPFSDYLELYFQ